MADPSFLRADRNVCITAGKKNRRAASRETTRRNRVNSSCHSQSLFIRLRHGACQEEGVRPGRTRPGAAHLEDDVVARLETPGDAAPIAEILDGLVIHFLDDVA